MIGRPLKFKTPEELQEKIDAYFASCQDDSGRYVRPITITGLALALDTSRETLCEYEEKDAFVDTVKRAKLRVEQFAEEQLYLLKNATGAIFALKNFGWEDRQQREHSGSVDVTAAKAALLRGLVPDAPSEGADSED